MRNDNCNDIPESPAGGAEATHLSTVSEAMPLLGFCAFPFPLPLLPHHILMDLLPLNRGLLQGPKLRKLLTILPLGDIQQCGQLICCSLSCGFLR